MSMRKFFQNESGATAIEYGLIAALISIAVVGAANSLASKTSTTFNEIGAELDTAVAADAS